MTREEMNQALSNLGLIVPETERQDILLASKYVEEMRNLVRKTSLQSSSLSASLIEPSEPAHAVCFSKVESK